MPEREPQNKALTALERLIHAAGNAEHAFEVLEGQASERERLHEYFQGKWIFHPNQVEKLLRGEINGITPINAELVPSLECPFNCPHCTYIQTGWRKRTIEQKGERMMDFSSMKILIDKLEEAGVKSLTFTGGGEPLTNPFCVDGIEYAMQKGLDAGLFTNGALLDKDKIRRLLRTELTFIRLSLNAGIEEVHNKFHGLKKESFFARVVKNLELLAEEKVASRSRTTIGVGVIVNPVNVGNLGEIAQLLKSIVNSQERDGGIDYVIFRPTVIYIPGRPQYPKEIFERAQEEIGDKVLPVLEGTSIRVANIEGRFEDVAKEEKDYQKCLAHPWAVSVAYDGGVYLCSETDGMEDYLLGNLLTQSFDEIWQSERRRDVIENIGNCPPICKLHFYNKIFSQLLPISPQDLPRVKEWIDAERQKGPPEHVNFP